MLIVRLFSTEASQLSIDKVKLLQCACAAEIAMNARHAQCQHREICVEPAKKRGKSATNVFHLSWDARRWRVMHALSAQALEGFDVWVDYSTIMVELWINDRGAVNKTPLLYELWCMTQWTKAVWLFWGPACFLFLVLSAWFFLFVFPFYTL